MVRTALAAPDALAPLINVRNGADGDKPTPNIFMKLCKYTHTGHSKLSQYLADSGQGKCLRARENAARARASLHNRPHHRTPA